MREAQSVSQTIITSADTVITSAWLNATTKDSSVVASQQVMMATVLSGWPPETRWWQEEAIGVIATAISMMVEVNSQTRERVNASLLMNISRASVPVIAKVNAMRCLVMADAPATPQVMTTTASSGQVRT
jgi:hypothetical protein